MNAAAYTTDCPRPLVAVSACLLGEAVRYDGGHKRHDFLVDVLARHVDCMPLCPEAGIGLGVPRPPIQLVGEPGRVRAIGVRDPSIDVTLRLQAYAEHQLTQLQRASGFLFKQHSPSCGLRRVKLFARPGRDMRRRGTGIFAAAVSAALPLLPVEEEAALDDLSRRQRFLCRLYTFRRWQALLDAGGDRRALQAFHDAHFHLVMAHSRAAARRLSRLLAMAPDAGPADSTLQMYARELHTALARPASVAGHSAAQQALADDLQPRLSPPRRAALDVRLQAYRDGRASLDSALAALREAMPDKHDIIGHAYLHPFPDSLRK